MSPAELAGACAFRAPFRSRQVFHWLSRGAAGFEEMTDLSLAERERLVALFPKISSSEVSAEFEDEDGSFKLHLGRSQI